MIFLEKIGNKTID